MILSEPEEAFYARPANAAVPGQSPTNVKNQAARAWSGARVLGAIISLAVP